MLAIMIVKVTVISYKMKNDHYDGKHFSNNGKVLSKSLIDLLRFFLGNNKTEKWPEFVVNQKTPMLAPKEMINQCYITYINHMTHLIQLPKLNILSDPIFSKRASPFSFLGPKRVRDPGIPLDQLPSIDIVIISHNHYDHMDIPSLIKLSQLFNSLMIVPLGNAVYLNKHGIQSIIELDWWQSHQINETQTITLLPSIHWSKRGLFDENKALWGGYWISSANHKIYFSGDTAYGDIFKTIQQKMGSPDISILPIGSYAPRWFMQPQHMDPNEAVLASIDLQSRLSIASHHQTFRLSYEGFEEPLNELRRSMQLHNIAEKDFLAPENGETVIL